MDFQNVHFPNPTLLSFIDFKTGYLRIEVCQKGPPIKNRCPSTDISLLGYALEACIIHRWTMVAAPSDQGDMPSHRRSGP